MPAPQPERILERRRTIGRRIQHERMQANLTQEHLRDLSGVDRATLQRIEAGTTDARLSWLLRIADALDTPLADLLRE
ncbi:helix-turn-helix transcriptional regulator [Streptomyces boncukensis]